MSKYRKKIITKPETASSEPGIHPNATVGPDASLDATFAIWKDKESTNAPQVGEEEHQLQYASGYPELFEKLLHEKIPLRGKTISFVIILAWFCFISWLFLQDNEAGKLGNIEGLKWFSIKASFYTALFVIASCLIGFVSWLTCKTNKVI